MTTSLASDLSSVRVGHATSVLTVVMELWAPRPEARASVMAAVWAFKASASSPVAAPSNLGASGVKQSGALRPTCHLRPYAPRKDRAASPIGAPAAQRSVGPCLRARKDRAAGLWHAHAGESVCPSLRVRKDRATGLKLARAILHRTQSVP